jgi:lysophospholipase L1-like esterase
MTSTPRLVKKSLSLFLFTVSAWAAEPRVVPGLVTTTPVTQDRDKAIYNWVTRHGEVLERNRVFKPDVVIVGDSIIHYWGGEPRAPLAWANEAWSNCFAGLKVTNLGYGWDRTENALWRMENGELGGIEPKVIVIKIGTNNTAVNNTPEDIAAGIEAVCVRVHEKQPQAKILLLGILTRKDEAPQRPSVTERVNKLLGERLGSVPWLTVRDFGPQFRNADGSPNVALFKDGVHVNAAGYEVLGKALRSEIQALLK